MINSAFRDIWVLMFDYFNIIVVSLQKVISFMNRPILDYLAPNARVCSSNFRK